MSIVRFYRGDPEHTPKTTMPAHLGANGILTCQGKLLLERRRDCGMWGLPGGGVKGREPERRAMVRELWEETIRSTGPPKFVEMNLKAFDLGYSAAREE